MQYLSKSHLATIKDISEKIGFVGHQDIALMLAPVSELLESNQYNTSFAIISIIMTTNNVKHQHNRTEVIRKQFVKLKHFKVINRSYKSCSSSIACSTTLMSLHDMHLAIPLSEPKHPLTIIAVTVLQKLI